jgi:hypothetical protein
MFSSLGAVGLSGLSMLLSLARLSDMIRQILPHVSIRRNGRIRLICRIFQNGLSGLSAFLA